MKTVKIVKIGGNIIEDKDALASFIVGFSNLEGPKILIHGGGNLASKLARKMNIEVKMINGRRITDAETLDIITMTYAGKINKNIVANLQANQCNSIGFTGADGNTIVSVKRPVIELDYGFVGDVVKVNAETINVLLNNDITPVFCAITHDKKGQLLNTNADTIASELAIGLSNQFRTELYYCFEKGGVLKDKYDDDSVIEKINTSTYQDLIEQSVISDGMLPKISNCFKAIQQHVGKVCIGKPEMLFKSNEKYTTITE